MDRIILAIKGQNLYAGGYNSYLYMSTDNGGHWNQLSTQLWSTTITDLMVSGTNLFAGTYDGVYRSSDNGANWTFLGLSLQGVNSLLSDGNNIYAGTSDGFYRSSDNGTHWTRIGINEVYMPTLAKIGSTLFAGINGRGVYRSSDEGTNWTESDSGLPDLYINTLASQGDFLYAGTSSVGIFISSDNGTTWTQAFTGLRHPEVQFLTSSGNTLYAGTYRSGLYSSTDEGMSWTPTGLTHTQISSLVSFNRGILVGTSYGHGVYYSSNNGLTWEVRNAWLWDTVVYSLVYDGSKVFAGTSYVGIMQSTDYGISWSNSLVTLNPINNFSICHTSLFAATGGEGIYRSTDAGLSWSLKNNGLANLNVLKLVTEGSNLYAANYNNIFLSTNEGDNWHSILTSSHINDLAVSGNALFVAILDSLYLTTNDGSTWKRVDSDALRDHWIKNISIQNSNIYVGTFDGGVWSCPLADLIPSGIVSSTELPTSYVLEQNYPNPFNPSTTICYQLPVESWVRINIYDIFGKHVELLTNGKQSVGYHFLEWNANTKPSGQYYYRLSTEKFTQVKKMLLMK